MFALGTNDFGTTRCYADGCTCLCETGAEDDGTCDTVDHKGYHLYRFGTSSKYYCYSSIVTLLTEIDYTTTVSSYHVSMY